VCLWHLARCFGPCAGCATPESWIDHENKRKNVQLEYIFFSLGYIALALAAARRPETTGANLWFYWVLPHMLGAGHLRYYQTAEHRACRLGSFTDTNAWIVSRTTSTWWLYAKLAWNMPYHSEHHAWPNVPFYLLPEVHAKIKESRARPTSGCNPGGDHGYLWMHCACNGHAPATCVHCCLSRVLVRDVLSLRTAHISGCAGVLLKQLLQLEKVA
jgi:hypothetical protein